MWHTGRPAADQCEGCTFMGWEMPWYSVPAESVDRLVAGRQLRDEVLLPA
jgi:hypothetical protein